MTRKLRERVNGKAVGSAVITKDLKQLAEIASSKSKGKEGIQKVDDHKGAVTHSTSSSMDPFNLKTISTLGIVKAKCILGPKNNYAQYDAKLAEFTLNASLHSDKAFALEKTVFQSGPFKGYQALVLVPVPQHKFSFLELPPEIRNLVYKALLICNGNRIVFNGNRKTSFRAWFEMSSPSKPKVRFLTTSDLIPVILLVCKQIYEEAAPILYGCNKFKLEDTTATGWSLKLIGSARRFLRKVEITGSFKPYQTISARFKDFARLLADSGQLLRLTLRLTYGYSDKTEDVGKLIAEDFKPVINMLIERGEDEAGVSETIRFGNSLCHCGSCFECHKFEYYKFRVRRGFKKEVVRYFAFLQAQKQEARLKKKSARILPAARRDTGRPKRRSADDRVSYVEIEEDEEEIEGETEKGEDESEISDTETDMGAVELC